MIAKPFLKWAGGKQGLIEQMTDRFPKSLIEGNIKKFIEPFIGGGAGFFDIVQKYNIEEAYISDSNSDLILTYNTIKYQVEPLIEALRAVQDYYYELNDKKREEYFYEKRTRFNELTELNYQKLLTNMNENTFVYFDPPYRPSSPTASFTAYTTSGFNDNNQRELKLYFKKLDQEKMYQNLN